MEERRRTGITSRAVVLAVAFCAVLLTLAVPLQQYFAQRGQIADLAAQEQAAKDRVAALERSQAQWHDPAYITQQARERLHFVKPGETAYVIIGPTPTVAPSVVAASPEASSVPVKGAWYDKLWSTVVTAGQEPTKAAPQPTRQRQTPGPIGPSPHAH
jgi:cell division protein FtsB